MHKICECDRVGAEINDGYVDLIAIHHSLHASIIARLTSNSAKYHIDTVVTRLDGLE